MNWQKRKAVEAWAQLEDVEFVLIPSKGANRALVSALSEDIRIKVRGLR